MKKNYRVFILCLVGAAMLCASVQSEAKGGEPKLDPKVAINSLKVGNERFANSQLVHPNQSFERRNELISGQTPKAVVISCSDSRVPPEIIFDQGLGDLFVIRVAGNVLNDENIGSAEYAVEHAGAPLIVVLGHKKCGAVTAAVGGGEMSGHLKSITDAIAPAVDAARKKSKPENVIEAAAHINVENVVQQLKISKPILAEMFQKGELKIVGAYYDLSTGKVEWLK